MIPVRLTVLTVAFALGLALVATGRQDPKDDKDPVDRKSTGYLETRNHKTKGVPTAKVEEYKPAFVAFAQYYAEAIAYPKRYTTLQDMTILVPREKTIDGILADLDENMFVPVPPNQVGTEQANYIREVGKALDDALKDVILKHPDRAVRVNATRLLARACRSGAHAHYPTVTALISQPTIRVGDVEVPVPAEVKYYALEAAGNLLAAHNLEAYNAIQGGYIDRNHSIASIKPGAKGPKPADPKAETEPVGALVLALQNAVLDPGSLLGVPPGMNGAPGPIPDDQKPVAAFFRRQAVRALGQVRFWSVPGPNNTPLYPAIVLARVAVADPALKISANVVVTPKTDKAKEVTREIVYSPRADEIAEAVIGIANMDPPERGDDRKVYGDGMSEVFAIALLSYGLDSTATPLDKTVPWKGGAARMTEAISRWRGRFHPTFSKPITINNPSLNLDSEASFNPTQILPKVQKVYADGKSKILDPIVLRNAKVDTEGMKATLTELRKDVEGGPAIVLFANPKLTVPRKY